MYGVLRLRGVPRPTRAQWRNLAVMAALLLGLGNGMVCIAQQSVSSGLAAVAVASAALVDGIVRGDARAASWPAGMAGARGRFRRRALAQCRRCAESPARKAWSRCWSHRWRGRSVRSGVVAAICRHRSWARPGRCCSAGAMMLVAGFTLGERMHDWPSNEGLLSVGYLLTFGSIIGFSAYIWLLHHVRPALAGSYAYVNPVIAMALGAWLAKEHFGTARPRCDRRDPARRSRHHVGEDKHGETRRRSLRLVTSRPHERLRRRVQPSQWSGGRGGVLRPVGIDAAVLAPAQGGAVVADRCPPHHLEHVAGGCVAAGGTGPRWRRVALATIWRSLGCWR